MASRPAPSQSEVESAFYDAMVASGFQPGAIQADTDRFQRFDAPGDRTGRENGFYKLRAGQYPVGWYGDWKFGEQVQWSWHESTGRELTPAERRQIKAEQRKLKIEAQQAREQKQAEVAEDASRLWKAATGDVAGHPYLVRKLIETPGSLRLSTDEDGTKRIAVPMYAFDMNGAAQLVGVQRIAPNGEKRFMTGQRVEGTFFSIKGDASVIVLCEGVATAFSIWQATGLSVVAAFNAGNLIPVAKEFAKNRPIATLLIAADDDAIAPDDWAERGQGRPWVNTGVQKAEAAAQTIGCRWIKPVFEAGQHRSRTDFNDLHAAEGLQAVAGQVMGALRSVEPEDAAPGAKIIEPDFVQDESWRAQIPVTAQGQPDGNNVQGVALYLANYRLLRDRLRFNAFTKEMEVDGKAMEGHHVADFRRIMHADRFKAKKSDVQDEMEAEARRNSFDPLADYLNGLKWDQKQRLDRWTTTYLGCRDTAYARTVGKKFLLAAVARALNPGCKVDTMIVLEGPQGSGKSTALRYLFGDRFFTDNLPDFHSKDSFQQLQGAWLIEVAELSALSKAEVKDVKQFLSRLVDKYRAPYERLPMSVPRRTVFAGTVNPEDGGYLRDPTGARRFWPLECGAIDLAMLLRDRDQIWAEAVSRYRWGDEWHLVDDEVVDATVEQEKRREQDAWEEPIRTYVREYSVVRLTVAKVLSDVLKIPVERHDLRMSRRVGACLRAMLWTAVPVRPGNGEKPTKVFMSPEGKAAHDAGGGSAVVAGAAPREDDTFWS